MLERPWLGNRKRRARSLQRAARLLPPVLITILVTALFAGPAGAAGPTVTGAGSSYAALAIGNWTAQVNQIYGININYQTSSSVQGLNEFGQGQIDFGASEIGYSANQAQVSAPSDTQYMPDVAGATCLMYNLNSATSQPITNLRLTPSLLLGIFTGKITNWNDPAIAQLNSTIALPSTPLNVVWRSDASGENYIFSDYFNTLYPSEWGAFTGAMGTAAGPQAIWPTPSGGGTSAGGYNEGNWVGQNGSDGAANYVSGTLNTMTYVETGYALEHNKPCVYVQNASGNFVVPSEDGDALALTHDQLQSDLEQNLIGVFQAPEANAYPISAYSYFVAHQGSMDPSKANVFAQFVLFAACTGQDAAGRLGYAPIPSNLVADDFAAVSRLPNHPPIPNPITAQNCPNPTITGAFPDLNPPGSNQANGFQVQPNGTTSTTGPNAGASGSGSGGGSGSSGSASAGSNGSAATSGAGSGSQNSGVLGGKSAIFHASGNNAATVPGGGTAAPGQQLGIGLLDAVNRLLGTSGPVAAILFWTIVFVALLGGPPLIAWAYRKRKGRLASSAPGNSAEGASS